MGVEWASDPSRHAGPAPQTHRLAGPAPRLDPNAVPDRLILQAVENMKLILARAARALLAENGACFWRANRYLPRPLASGLNIGRRGRVWTD
jgi:hypothetical protein